MQHTLPKLFVLWIAAASAACSVDDGTFTRPTVVIGGTIAGLDGSGLVLTMNGTEDLEISGNGEFAFPTPLSPGERYALTVKRQPSSPPQLCAIGNGNGTAGRGDVTDVQVICHVNAFRVGGTVTGLAGGGLVLQNSAGERLPVSADGAFAFASPAPTGASYDVTVAAQPALPTQTCAVTRGTGTMGAADVTDIDVTCATNIYSIGGSLTGLAPGNRVTIRNNGMDSVDLTGNGSFRFPRLVASGQPYSVTVVVNPVSPISQTCTVTAGTGAGTVVAADVTSVRITCLTNRFTIGGTVSGLTGPGLVLQNNGGNDLPIPGDGPFTFTATIPSGTTYNVTVRTHPPKQACTVTAGTGNGTVGASNVTSVRVTCVDVYWSPSMFPLPVPGAGHGAGDLDLDDNGDLLVVASTLRAIVRVDRATGAQTTVASGIGGVDLRGVAYRAANDMIYTHSYSGEIYAVTRTGSVTQIASLSDSLNAIAIAPPSFGSFGGFLIGVTQSGRVVAVNPTNGALTTITASAGAASDLAFAPDGTLYISGGPSVRTVTAAGVVAPFASGFSSADGITITPDGTRMFIADSGTDTVRQVTIPGAVVTIVGSADINSGYAVGGLLAAPGNTLIVMTGTGDLTLVAFPY